MMFLFPLLLTSLVNEWKHLHENSLSIWAWLAVLALKCPAYVALQVGFIRASPLDAENVWGVLQKHWISICTGFLFFMICPELWLLPCFRKTHPDLSACMEVTALISNHKWVFLGFGVRYVTVAINICWSLKIFSLGKYQKYKYGHSPYSSCQYHGIIACLGRQWVAEWFPSVSSKSGKVLLKCT